MPSIRKILIANRGEIALRIIRAARELGIATVAVYSGADREALHVLHADQAFPLDTASASYLDIPLILEVARKSGADAIHPGYGFLSENPDFVQACEGAGIKFIGPSSSAMRMLGSKVHARQAADRAGLPRTAGSTQALASLEEAFQVASSIGYPVMLKAAAGGGGKGMRAIARPEELAAAYRVALGEAQSAFGSAEVYLEKLIQPARHIEIQLIADEHGHCLYLGERECSVQRRHQKVIEEAPSAGVSPELRQRMGEAAVRLALHAGYTNAGTVEFLLDSRQDFYLLEVNTRLQVEHPVTEFVTGLDLVHLQIAVAEGAPLPLAQEDIVLRGHAIECRIYAEDPENNFFPSPGRVTRLVQPTGPGIREDCGIYEGWTVPVDFDPLLSKLIAYAPSRDAAIARMRMALSQYVIGGIRTNLRLFERILNDPAFVRGEMDTGYLDRFLEREKQTSIKQDEPERCSPGEGVAAAAAALFEAGWGGGGSTPPAQRSNHQPGSDGRPESTGWKRRAREEGLA